MQLEEILRDTSTRWLQNTGPASDIVISSRVRLARNLAEMPFPTRLSQEKGEEVLKRVEEGSRAVGEGLGEPLSFFRLKELSPLERQVLVEKHLISPQHARDADLAAVVLKRDESVSIMVNEEDHLRIQCLFPGLQLEEALELGNRVDDLLEQKIDYAFDADHGYLTTCPTNTGTGLRASVMMHLPGLVMTNQAAPVFNTLSKVGVTVRGLYGEGSQAIGNLFQVSNQLTLGQSEEEILENLQAISRQLIDRERSAREWVLSEMRTHLEDRVGRAYGILTNARVITSNEAMALLSDLRLGIDLNILSHVEPKLFNGLIVLTRPAYLQYWSGAELAPEDRDLRRALLIRERIKAHQRRSNAG